MTSSTEFLPTGYQKVRPGQIAAVVTCLEMTERPKSRPSRPLDRPLVLERVANPDLAAYRSLFSRIGQDYLWFSRIVMPDDELAATLANPKVEVSILKDGRREIGLMELDFRVEGVCELAFFGLVPEAIGGGAGRYMMGQALARAWSQPIKRLWVHTCNFDHPGAIGFYVKSGFRPYAFEVEIADDPRLSGKLPRHAAPHVPLIEA